MISLWPAAILFFIAIALLITAAVHFSGEKTASGVRKRKKPPSKHAIIQKDPVLTEEERKEMMNSLKNIVRSQPSDAAKIVRSWINEDKKD